eukprot:gene3725-4639_t
MGYVFLYSVLAGIAPLISASIPFFIFKSNINKKYFHFLLCLSAGLLFAVATLELLPEATELSIVSQGLPIINHNNKKQPPQQQQQQQQKTSTDIDINKMTTTRLLIPDNKEGEDNDDDKKSTSYDFDDKYKKNRNKRDLSFLNEDDHPQHDEHGHDDHDHDDEEDSIKNRSRVPMFGIGAGFFVLILIESLFLQDSNGDGLVISSAFSSNSSVGARVAIAIVIHKIPDGLVMSSIVLSQKRAANVFNPFLYFLIISCMTPLGSVISTMLLGGIPPSTVSFVLGFGAGTFLYITSTGILPEILHAKFNKSISMLFICIGYFLFILIDSNIHAH